MEPGRQRLSQRRRAAALALGSPADRLRTERSDLVQNQPEAWPGRNEFEDLSRSGVADTAVALPQSPSSAHPIGTKATTVPDAVPARPRRIKQFGVTGILALIITAGAASVPVVVAHPAPNAEGTAPTVVIPASDLGSGASQSTGDHTGRVVAQNTSADSVAPAAVAATPEPRATRNDNRTTGQLKRGSARVTPPPDTRATSAEAFLWSQADALGARDQRWKYLSPPRR